MVGLEHRCVDGPLNPGIFVGDRTTNRSGDHGTLTWLRDPAADDVHENCPVACGEAGAAGWPGDLGTCRCVARGVLDQGRGLLDLSLFPQPIEPVSLSQIDAARYGR